MGKNLRNAIAYYLASLAVKIDRDIPLFNAVKINHNGFALRAPDRGRKLRCVISIKDGDIKTAPPHTPTPPDDVADLVRRLREDMPESLQDRDADYLRTYIHEQWMEAQEAADTIEALLAKEGE